VLLDAQRLERFFTSLQNDFFNGRSTAIEEHGTGASPAQVRLSKFPLGSARFPALHLIHQAVRLVQQIVNRARPVRTVERQPEAQLQLCLPEPVVFSLCRFD